MLILCGGQYHIHKLLEHWQRIAHSKIHNLRLECSKTCFECHLPLVAVLDMDVVVTPSHVKLSKYPGVFNLLDQIRD